MAVKVPSLLHKMSPTYQKAWYKRNKMPLPAHLTGSVAQASKEVKPSERVKSLRAKSLKAYGATKGTRMGSDDGSGESLRDTIVPLTRDQYSKVQKAARDAKVATKPAAPAKQKKPLSNAERLAIIARAAKKSRLKDRFDVPTMNPDDIDHDDLTDLHRSLHIGKRYNEEVEQTDEAAADYKKAFSSISTKNLIKDTGAIQRKLRRLGGSARQNYIGMQPTVDMSNKVTASVTKKRSYSEEVEQIDEISPKTAQSYLDKRPHPKVSDIARPGGMTRDRAVDIIISRARAKKIIRVANSKQNPSPPPKPTEDNPYGYGQGRYMGDDVNLEGQTMNEVTKKEAEEMLGGPVKDKPKGPAGKKPLGMRLARSAARKALRNMQASMKKEDVEQIEEEGKITHIVAKDKLQDHKDEMESEGYDTHTKPLPANHPKAKTHIGIVSKSPVESSYHETMGHAKEIDEAIRGTIGSSKSVEIRRPADQAERDKLASDIAANRKYNKGKIGRTSGNIRKNAAGMTDAQKLVRTLYDKSGRSNKELGPKKFPYSEEVEQIDELKKSTLASYVKRATRDVASASRLQRGYETDAMRKGDAANYVARGSDLAAKTMRKFAAKRSRGIAKAVDKLAKEEVEQIEEGKADTSLAAKAQKSGVSLGTLKSVFRRGVAAWNSGHRPGTTPSQWGHARVNSYINKGKTYHTADKDLRENSELVGEEKDEREYGYEGDMVMSQLKSVISNAQQMHDMLKPDTDLPEWVQSKVTLAEDYIVTAVNYMEGEMNEEVEQIDEKINLVKDKMGDVIKDFQDSDAPQFKGKSKEKRREMAIAAKLGAEREGKMDEEFVTEAEGTVAVTSKEKALAAHHGDKTKITYGDVIKARLKSAAEKAMKKR